MQVMTDMDNDDYFDLGTYKRPITTSSSQAQLWFDRGLIWCYGFNHEEAINCFHKAISYDPHAAMCYWGLAFALGPNYNKPWEVYDKADLQETLKKTHAAAAKASELVATSGSDLEKALIEAIQVRYLKDHAVDEDPMTWNKLYSIAMEKVYKSFGDDLDVECLFADSLMNLCPWKLWDIHTGKPSKHAPTLQVRTILENSFQRPGALQHPGLLHLYIHLMEMSPTPEAALPIADNLRGLVPDAGHLQHMPSHLDVLCGDWRRAVASNTDAVKADEKYVARCGPVNFYTLYRCHDYHFKLYGAMFAGMSEASLETASALAKCVPEDLLRVESPPMADWLEGFLTMNVHALIRFGKWQEIVDLQLPQDSDLYCFTTAMMLYGKGVAHSAMGNIEEAENARKDFLLSVPRVHKSRAVFNIAAEAVLAIASAMLDGELEYRKQNYDVAFEHLRHAVHLDDSLDYDEPWGWLQPTRHALGALLLEQNHVQEAAAVYAADLGFDTTLPRALQHPNNVWALHGYHECLKRLGRHAEAVVIEKQLSTAMASADIQISSSCYCRRSEDGPARTVL
ncbi:TPR domain protein [Venturia nashicola]|uniref:TPR domain protein n=1 Tax=Venturia nashicola TaxID=86259 RepID=A0A4Z1P0D6_9PEZI|nr:TPR domain protein [Venturia nashicola]